MSSLQLRGARGSGRRALAACVAVALFASAGIADAAAAAEPGNASSQANAVLAKAKKKKKKKCKKGYKRVTVKVKRKRAGKRVTVKVKKCRKAKRKAKPAPRTPGPTSPSPSPSPSPSGPKIDQILGWSTLAQDPDTPPPDLVADGGTISTCPTNNHLSVYIRRSGVTALGQVSHVWKRDGVEIASGTNSSTYNGAFRHGITISPLNGLYEIVWSSGGKTIGSASITRSC